MNEAARLAGFLAAHAMLQVAKGATLCPLIIFEKRDGTSHIVAISHGTPEQAAHEGEDILMENADGTLRGVMAMDAYLNLPKGRSDAIFLQARQFEPPARPLLMAVPYRHPNKPGGFAVHRPKIFAFDDEPPLPEAELVAAFFDGVDKHETGGKFWNQHYDGSY